MLQNKSYHANRQNTACINWYHNLIQTILLHYDAKLQNYFKRKPIIVQSNTDQLLYRTKTLNLRFNFASKLLLSIFISFCFSLFYNNHCLAANNATASLSIGNTTLSANAKSGEVAYLSNAITINAINTEKYILKITGPTSLKGSTPTTGAGNNTPVNMANNSWGYAYDQGIDTTTNNSINNTKIYSSFTGSPQTLETGTTATNATRDITFAAKFDANAEAGHYTASITLSLVATPATTTYTLAYDGNSNEATAVPASQTCTIDGTSGTPCITTISPTKPNRPKYNFIGWNTNRSATSTIYQPNSEITLTANTTLYAIWEDGPAVTGFGGIRKMQDMTKTVCDSVSTGTSGQLYDTRDDNIYNIYKFKDNRCWMTTNLKLTGSKTLTSTDSDVNSDFTLPAPSQFGFNAETVAHANLANSADSGETGYYSWCAATAQTCSSAALNAVSSICPKGWQLPTGGANASTSDFYKFTTAENITDSEAGFSKIQSPPYDFKYTGWFYNNQFLSVHTEGYWWSSTTAGTDSALALYVYNDNHVNSRSYKYRRFGGYAVRCIARNE